MCGIIAYAGHRNACPIIIEGLKRLEYRGYDSAGLAIMDSEQIIHIRKSVGKVQDLVQSIGELLPNGNLGVGHTRWATHGKPTLENCHPHVDCSSQLAVVHNGILENSDELKQELVRDGHFFRSETDTEVISHLIEDLLNQGYSLQESFLKLTRLVSGGNAVVAIHKSDPNTIIALRVGNSGGIAVTTSEKEVLIGSDTSAVSSLSNKIDFLDNHEVLIATSGTTRFLKSSGKQITKPEHAHHSPSDPVNKGKYSHFMVKEIDESPNIVSALTDAHINNDASKVLADDFFLSTHEIKKVKKVMLIGCGTSLHAAMIGRYMIESISGIPAESESSSEFRYREYNLNPETLVISIGQSGETADTLAAMDRAKAQEARLLTISNTMGSQATRLAEQTLWMKSGIEIGVASTKTFIASLTILSLLAILFSQERNPSGNPRQKALINELLSLPDKLDKALQNHNSCFSLAEEYHHFDNFLYLGRGIDYPVALEGALKLKETSYIHAEGYPAGEMKHGPIALVDSNLVTITIETNQNQRVKMLNNIKEIKARDGQIISLGNDGDNDLKQISNKVIYIPETAPMLSPILSSIPLQLFSYYAALKRGRDVDQPRNLAKSVTVE